MTIACLSYQRKYSPPRSRAYIHFSVVFDGMRGIGYRKAGLPRQVRLHGVHGAVQHDRGGIDVRHAFAGEPGGEASGVGDRGSGHAGDDGDSCCAFLRVSIFKFFFVWRSHVEESKKLIC